MSGDPQLQTPKSSQETQHGLRTAAANHLSVFSSSADTQQQGWTLPVESACT
jgi:hypothetical protein